MHPSMAEPKQLAQVAADSMYQAPCPKPPTRRAPYSGQRPPRVPASDRRPPRVPVSGRCPSRVPLFSGVVAPSPSFWREGQGDSARLPRKGPRAQGDSAQQRPQKGGLGARRGRRRARERDSAQRRLQKGGLGAGRGLTRPARTTARPEKGLVAGRDQPTRLA